LRDSLLSAHIRAIRDYNQECHPANFLYRKGLTMGIGGAEMLILVLIGALPVWPCWRICTKAGLPGALGLVSLIPAGLFVLLFVWALVDWPAVRRTGADLGA
jgi:hypothetical protein